MFIGALLNVTYISGFPGISIHWLALVVLYWASYRPEWQPTLLVFIAGLIYDFMSGTHLVGITPLIAVSMHVLLRNQSHLILAFPFWAVWLITAAMIAIWRGVEALADGLLLGLWPSFGVWFGSAVITALAFPLVAVCMAPLRRIARP